MPAQRNDHILRVEISAISQQGTTRLEGGGQEVLSHANPSAVETRVNQTANLSIAQNGELRWFLAPNSQFRLQRIRVFQLK